MDGSNPYLQEDRQRYEATSEIRHQSCAGQSCTLFGVPQQKQPLVRSQRQNIAAFSQVTRFYHTTSPSDKRMPSRTPEMEIIKSSDAFTSTQPMEATAKATTWHWPSSCRSASAKRFCRHACHPFQRASEQSMSTTSTYGNGLELTGIEARNQADESKQSLG